ncbi:MlaA family lipoprotein [Burkholderia multivorans]|uniref:MlaA family lipoprotein n=1 Tax=Burkholderia multivorans TaxID=87883 RepID=UPI00358F11EF
MDQCFLSWGLYGVNLVNTRANLLGAGDVLDAAALDKYSFVRNAYLQRRQMLINNARGEAGAPASNDALPQYELPDDTAAPAAAGAAGSAGAAAVGGAAAPAGASAAEPASGAAAPNPASATTVPPMQVTPPAPGGLRLPSFRLH